MTLFTTLNDIIQHKRGNVLYDMEAEKEYSPYMINRWLSMYSQDYALIINETVNRFWGNFTVKLDHYQFLCKVLPTNISRPIQYIKKEKSEKVKENKEAIEFLARNFELSHREIKEYIAMANIDLKKLKIKLE